MKRRACSLSSAQVRQHHGSRAGQPDLRVRPRHWLLSGAGRVGYRVRSIVAAHAAPPRS